MELNEIDTDDVYDIWPFISSDIKDMVAKDTSDNAMREIDYFDRLSEGNLRLLLLTDEYQVVKGFFLVKVIMLDGKRVLVPHLTQIKGVHKYADLLDRATKDMAKTYNCDEIQFISTMSGIIDSAKKYGYVDGGVKDFNGVQHNVTTYNMRTQ